MVSSINHTTVFATILLLCITGFIEAEQINEDGAANQIEAQKRMGTIAASASGDRLRYLQSYYQSPLIMKTSTLKTNKNLRGVHNKDSIKEAADILAALLVSRQQQADIGSSDRRLKSGGIATPVQRASQPVSKNAAAAPATPKAPLSTPAHAKTRVFKGKFMKNGSGGNGGVGVKSNTHAASTNGMENNSGRVVKTPRHGQKILSGSKRLKLQLRHMFPSSSGGFEHELPLPGFDMLDL